MYTPQARAEIKAQIIADIEGEIGQDTPILSRAFTRVIANALSGVIALLLRRILWAFLQIFTATCGEVALAYKERKYGITPSPALAAILSITITGDDGKTCKAGTYWTSPDNGLVYLQDAAAIISGSTATASVTCQSAGEDSTLAAGATLSLVSPQDGIVSAVVASVTTEGQDADTLEERRAVVADREKRTDEIGTSGWYIAKALEVPGVALARAKRLGTGDVDVYPVLALSGPSRVPSAGMLATIQAYIGDELRRPFCASVYALAPVERTATVTISGLDPADVTTKANIDAAIQAYFYAAYPRQYSDEVDATDKITRDAISAIVSANGASSTGIDLTISGIGSGVTSYTLPVGEIIKGVTAWA